MEYIVIFAVIVIGGYVFVSNLLKRRHDDFEAFAWASRREPIIFIQEHETDQEVQQRHAEAIAKLETYGNKFLTANDCWLFMYRVDTGIVGDITAIDVKHSVWYDMVLTEVAQRKRAWIANKTTYIGTAAGEVFAGQKINANQN